MNFFRPKPIKGLSLLHRVEGVTSTETAEGVFLFDAAGGRLFQLNPSAKAVWAGIEIPIPLDELCARLVSEFAGDADTIRRDVVSLLEELRQARVIRVSAGDGDEP